MAEQIFFKEVTTGASNDLERATAIARSLITQFGMNKKLGFRTFGKKEEMVFLGKEIHERRDYSEKTAEEIDQEISEYIQKASQTAEKVITEHREQMEMIVKTLVEKETIEKEEFEKLVA